MLGAQTLAALATLFSGDDVDDDSSLSDDFLSTHTSHDDECDGSMSGDHQDG